MFVSLLYLGAAFKMSESTVGPPTFTIGPIQLLGPSGYQRVGCHGRFANAVHIESGKRYLAHVLQPACRFQCRSEIESAVALGRSIRHPSILRCYGKVEEGDTCVVLWEPAEACRCPLSDVCGTDLHAQQRLIIELLTATAILSQNGCHLLILRDDDLVVVKSSDQECVKVMPGEPLVDYGIEQAEDVHRLPPEMFDVMDDLTSAVWCIGVLAFEMLAKSAPFGEGRAAVDRIAKCKYDVEKLSPYSIHAKHFFSTIFQLKKDRPSVDALLYHPWFDETLTSEEKAEILSAKVLISIIPEHLLPLDVCERLASYMSYVQRWSLA